MDCFFLMYWSYIGIYDRNNDADQDITTSSDLVSNISKKYRRSVWLQGLFIKKYAYQKGEINSRYLIILCTDDIVVYGN